MGRRPTSVQIQDPERLGRVLDLVFATYNWRSLGTPQFPKAPKRLSLRAALALVPSRVRISDVALMAILAGRRGRIHVDTFVFLHALFEVLASLAPDGRGAAWQYPDLARMSASKGGRIPPQAVLDERLDAVIGAALLSHKVAKWNEMSLAYRRLHLSALEMFHECLTSLRRPASGARRRTQAARGRDDAPVTPRRHR